MKHYSVLLSEAINSLNVKSNSIYVDATLGRAGHAIEILKKIDGGMLYCFDQDMQAIKESETKLKSISNNFKIIKSNFKNIKAKLLEEKINKIDGIIYDLGISSPQLDQLDRGFSYKGNAPLDMRMDQDAKLTAFNVVNNYSQKELATIIKNYGEERFANNIAKRIIETRSQQSIKSTEHLVEVIKSAIPMKFHKDKHPARKTFQAIRIEVNDELNSITKSLTDALELLNSGGVMAVISFHSLEDRIVKTIFKTLTTQKKDFNNPLPDVDETKYELINKKPIVASKKELLENKRSRSAKLRIIKRR